MCFMEKDDEFRSFFTAANHFLFYRFLSSFCCKPETVLQGIIFFVYTVEGCRHESAEIHKSVIDGPARNF